MEMIDIKENILWPKVEEKFLLEENVKFIVQINGKTRKIIDAKKDTSESLLLNKITERILSLFFGNFFDKKTFIDTDDLFL